MTIEIWAFVLSLVGAVLGGLVAGFFITRWWFQKQIKENPPINEKMIRAMFASMGRKASEKQIREIMRNVNSQN
jgi:uncharacterized protein YneF (UPF0154 family)